MNDKRKKILVIGSSGLVGGNLLSSCFLYPFHTIPTFHLYLPNEHRHTGLRLDITHPETLQKTLETTDADLLIGHSKGYAMSRQLGLPLIRVGFPVHDRVDGSRLLHVGYRGAQQLFDRIANTIIEMKQEKSDVGYTYY